MKTEKTFTFEDDNKNAIRITVEKNRVTVGGKEGAVEFENKGDFRQFTDAVEEAAKMAWGNGGSNITEEKKTSTRHIASFCIGSDLVSPAFLEKYCSKKVVQQGPICTQTFKEILDQYAPLVGSTLHISNPDYANLVKYSRDCINRCQKPHLLKWGFMGEWVISDGFNVSLCANRSLAKGIAYLVLEKEDFEETIVRIDLTESVHPDFSKESV